MTVRMKKIRHIFSVFDLCVVNFKGIQMVDMGFFLKFGWMNEE